MPFVEIAMTVAWAGFTIFVLRTHASVPDARGGCAVVLGWLLIVSMWLSWFFA